MRRTGDGRVPEEERTRGSEFPTQGLAQVSFSVQNRDA